MTSNDPAALTGAAAAAAVQPGGWRLLLNGAYTSVAVDSPAAGVAAVAAAVRACGAGADHLHADLRPHRVEFALRTPSDGRLSRRDAELAGHVTAALADEGFRTTPGGAAGERRTQVLEIAIDALDIPAVLPFWRAVLGYVDAPGLAPGEQGLDVVDPAWQGPNFWFQQMDEPRPQRNRIHFDLHVADDEADERIAAALAAGGRLISDAEARAFWILADPEGNEVCICTWQDRE